MIKRLLLLPVLCAIILCDGCFTLATATTDSLKHSYYSSVPGKPREHVVVSNYGWYLFNCIPLVCGNAKRDAILPWRFLHDDVTTDVIQDRLTEYAANKGADLVELTLFVNDNVLFEVPGTSIPIPMPYVLCYHERLLSALLIDPPLPGSAPAPADAPPDAKPQTPSVQTEPTQNAEEDDKKQEIKQLLNAIPDGGVK
jgi:hypothetical protein